MAVDSSHCAISNVSRAMPPTINSDDARGQFRSAAYGISRAIASLPTPNIGRVRYRRQAIESLQLTRRRQRMILFDTYVDNDPILGFRRVLAEHSLWETAIFRHPCRICKYRNYEPPGNGFRNSWMPGSVPQHDSRMMT